MPSVRGLYGRSERFECSDSFFGMQDKHFRIPFPHRILRITSPIQPNTPTQTAPKPFRQPKEVSTP